MISHETAYIHWRVDHDDIGDGFITSTYFFDNILNTTDILLNIANIGRYVPGESC